MRGSTHILFSFFVITLVYELIPTLGSFIPFAYTLSISLFGSITPDIDHPSSYVSRGNLKSFSVVISTSTPHRGWTHSIFGAVLFTVVLVLFLWYLKIKVTYALPFFVSYVIHLFADSLNPTGVNWFWPKSKKYGINLIKTGSKEELILQKLLILGFIGLLVYDAIYNRNIC